MKSFVKFIVTLLVLCTVGYTVYYFVINNEEWRNTDVSGELPKQDKPNINFGDSINNNSISKSGDVLEDNTDFQASGDVFVKNESGEVIIETVISKEERISMIDKEVETLSSGEILKSISEELSSELVSESARSFMTYFKLNELPVTINIRERCIEIIPTSDFLENMVYYYDENGDLVLFESISNTVGGSSKYYFNENMSVEVIFDYEEEVENNEEYIFDVLNRGKAIYDKYLK